MAQRMLVRCCRESTNLWTITAPHRHSTMIVSFYAHAHAFFFSSRFLLIFNSFAPPSHICSRCVVGYIVIDGAAQSCGLGTVTIKTEVTSADMASTTDGFGGGGGGSSCGNSITTATVPHLQHPVRSTIGCVSVEQQIGGAQQQPLQSNVIGKQQQQSGGGGGGGMEYMQTQNHIFVFSTTLANKSAEAVMNRQYSSIIAYHCAQPGSKKFLEVSRCDLNFHECVSASVL